MLSDAELLLGLGRHLSAYGVSPAHAALESLQYGGQVYEMAWRLRNSQVSTAARIEAIGIEAQIGPLRLRREVLPTMQQLGWVDCRHDQQGALTAVEALIPPNADMIDDAARLLDILLATPLQRAALELIRATSRQPLAVEAATQVVSHWGEQVAEEALGHLGGWCFSRGAERFPVITLEKWWWIDPSSSGVVNDVRFSAHAG